MRRLTCGIFSLIIIAAGGCAQGEKFNTEAERLREQFLELETRIRELERRNDELQAALASAAAAPGSISEDVRANIPHVAAIEIGRLSHARDTDEDGWADELIVYVVPRDGLSRFVQFAGSIGVNAAILPADSPAQTIGQARLGPAQVREAYRYSFAGLHYSVAVPIQPPLDSSIDTCVVAVELQDGQTGRTFRAERSIELRPK